MEEPNSEVEVLRAECERLRRDRDALRNDLVAIEGKAVSLADAQLKLVANGLSKEIKNDFYETVKRGLWILALVAGIATAGGVITISDLLRARIDTAVEGKHKEIEKLREGIIGALVEVKVRAEAANREVEVLKSDVEATKKQFLQLRQQVEKEGTEAIALIRGVTLSVTSTVDATGKESTQASAVIKQSYGAQIPTKGISTASDWFGPLPPGVVGIAGSSFDQSGYEIYSEGKPHGAFSFWFQKMLRDPTADKDKNRVISLREAVEAVAPKLKEQTPLIVGENQKFSLFSLSKIKEADLPKRKIWAVLVGINTYSKISLAGPVNDVRGFADLLRDPNLFATDVSVTQVLNEEATLANIRSSVEALEKVSSPQDVIIFYFSGHQSKIPNTVSNSPALLKTLIPYDYEAARFLPVNEVVQWLFRIPAKQRIFVADV